jgi:hypothetical protein
MRTTVLFAISCLTCLVLVRSPVRAEPRLDFVRGDIKSLNGNLVRIDDSDIRLASSVVIVTDRKDTATPALAVGQNVTARIEDGLATRVEIHTQKSFHGNGSKDSDKK